MDFLDLDAEAPMILSLYPPFAVGAVDPPSGAGGTSLTVSGRGFDRLATASPACVFTAADGSASRLTMATRAGDETLHCLSPPNTFALYGAARSRAGNATADAGDDVEAEADEQALLAANGRPTLFVRFGVSLNGFDVVRATGAVPPPLPISFSDRLRGAPPPSPPPLVWGEAGGGGNGTNGTSANETTVPPEAPMPAPPPIEDGGHADRALPELNASSADAFAIYMPPRLSSIAPTGASIGSGLPLTVYGEGFEALRAVRDAIPTAASGQCRFGGEHDGVIVSGSPLGDGAFVCSTPIWTPREPGIIPVEVSLNAVDGVPRDFVGGAVCMRMRVSSQTRSAFAAAPRADSAANCL